LEIVILFLRSFYFNLRSRISQDFLEGIIILGT
jgi:hypothetical protein